MAELTPWGLQRLSVEASCPTAPPPGPVYPCGETDIPRACVSPGAVGLSGFPCGLRVTAAGWSISGRGYGLAGCLSGLVSGVLSACRATRGPSCRTNPIRPTAGHHPRNQANQASPFSGAQCQPTGRTAHTQSGADECIRRCPPALALAGRDCRWPACLLARNLKLLPAR